MDWKMWTAVALLAYTAFALGVAAGLAIARHLGWGSEDKTRSDDDLTKEISQNADIMRNWHNGYVIEAYRDWVERGKPKQ